MMNAAETILSQLGGSKFQAMTGARGFNTTGGADLNFSLPRSVSKKWNGVRIALNGNDLYDVTFYDMRPRNIAAVKDVTDVDAANLCILIETVTGARVSL